MGMKRRNFLKLITSSVPFMLCGCSGLWQRSKHNHAHHNHQHVDDLGEIGSGPSKVVGDPNSKVVNFDQDFPDDIFCTPYQLQMVQKLVRKFRATQRYVGHGNFNLLGMDEFFFHARNVPSIGAVTDQEKLYLEELFHFDATLYGFYGD